MSDSPKTMTGQLRLLTIAPVDNGKFEAVIRIGDSPKMTVTVVTKDLESFNAFRRAVTAQLSCWMTHDLAEQGGRYGNKCWREDVEDAFGRGSPTNANG